MFLAAVSVNFLVDQIIHALIERFSKQRRNFTIGQQIEFTRVPRQIRWELNRHFNIVRHCLSSLPEDQILRLRNPSPLKRAAFQPTLVGLGF